MRHCIAFEGRTSRLWLAEAPYEYQTCWPTVSIVAAASGSPSCVAM